LEELMAQGRVLVTRRIPPPAAEMLSGAGLTMDLIDSDDPASRSELLRRLAGADALIATLTDRIDAEALDAAGGSLKVVANFAVGYDNVDVPECTRRGVRVTNTPGVLTDATADLAWALILAAARHVAAGDALVRHGDWKGWAPLQLLGLQLSGATLGILGAGRIGSAVARRSVGFGMKVIYTDQRANPELERELEARRVDFNTLLAEADVLSVHIPLSAESRHLIGAPQLARMKPTAVLVNTARGPIIDEAALVDALRSGRIAAAGLDVYENEPRLTPGLSELSNVVLLPHLGSATTTTRQRMSQMTAENAIAVLSGREPPNPVN